MGVFLALQVAYQTGLMAIDIYAVQRSAGRAKILEETHLQLKTGGIWEDLDGYFFILEKKTGIRFDPYGDTYLHPDHAKLMLSIMERASHAPGKQPKENAVVLGKEYKGGPDNKKMVPKSDLSHFISAFQVILKKAVEERLEIGFTGD